jgi:putative transposase
MKQVIKVRMLPTDAEAMALDATLRACNAASTWLSQQMHASRTFRKYDAHHRFYAELRERFGLASQPTIRVIAKVADAYASLHANVSAGTYGPLGSNRRRRVEASPIKFRPLAAQPFDARCLSWRFSFDETGRTGAVSIWTVAGRLNPVRILGKPRHLIQMCGHIIGKTHLIHRDGKWFLHATFEAPEAPLSQPVNGFLGVDLGVVNIATTSTGKTASGGQLIRYRRRQIRLRKRLQARRQARRVACSSAGAAKRRASLPT